MGTRLFVLAALVVALLSALPALPWTMHAGQVSPSREIFIAVPGERFGPFHIGAVQSFVFWYARCVDSDLTTYWLSNVGLEVTFQGEERWEQRIESLTAGRQLRIFPSIYDECQLSSDRGPRIRTPIRAPQPTHISYVTSGGVTFGTTVERVLAAHGTPRRAEAYANSPSIATLEYCGLTLHFGAGVDGDLTNGLARITVSRCRRS